jgi:hypothetical protein
MNKQEQFLIKEYDTATKLIFHIDELRNKLTALFLSIASIGAAGLAVLFKGESGNYVKITILMSLLTISLVGVLIVMILGRLRSNQIEHIRISDKIREYFIECNDYRLWNIIEKSVKTQPKPKVGSTPYYWVMIIIMVGSLAFALFVYFCYLYLVGMDSDYVYWLISCVFIFFFWFQRDQYFELTASRLEPIYSEDNPPCK